MDSFFFAIELYRLRGVPLAIAAASPAARSAAECSRCSYDICGANVSQRKAVDMLSCPGDLSTARKVKGNDTKSLLALRWWLHRSFIPLMLECSPNMCTDTTPLPDSVVSLTVSTQQVSAGPPLPKREVNLAPCFRKYRESIGEIQLENIWPSSESMGALVELRNLHTISIHWCAIGNVDWASGCSSLKNFELTGCTAVTDISPLTRLKSLKQVDVMASGITDLSPLSQCIALEAVLFQNTGVEAVAPLRGCSLLKSVSTGGSKIVDISPLAQCKHLSELYLSNCRSFLDLNPLKGNLSVQILDVSYTKVTDVSALSSCRTLKILNLSGCSLLTDLSPLTDLPSLKEIHSQFTGVRILEGLAHCPLLEILSFNGSEELRDLSPLAGAPSLKVLEANNTLVNDVTPLLTCTRLTVVSLFGCASLPDIHPLIETQQGRCVWKFDSGDVRAPGTVQK